MSGNGLQWLTTMANKKWRSLKSQKQGPPLPFLGQKGVKSIVEVLVLDKTGTSTSLLNTGTILWGRQLFLCRPGVLFLCKLGVDELNHLVEFCLVEQAG